MRLLLRKVHGGSMAPLLRAGQIVLFFAPVREITPGTIVMLNDQGVEKIKIIEKVQDGKVWYRGASDASTDSRDVGWVARPSIRAKLVWPLRRQKQINAYL